MRKKLPFLFTFLFLVSIATVSAQLNIGELLENTGLDAFFVEVISPDGRIAEPYGVLYLRIILFIIVFALFYGVSNLVLANIEKRPRIFVALGLGLLSVVAIPVTMLQTLVSGYAVGLFVTLALVLILGAVYIGHKIGESPGGRFAKGVLFLFAGYFVQGMLVGGLANLGGVIPAPTGGIGLNEISSILTLVSVIMVFMGFWYIFTSFSRRVAEEGGVGGLEGVGERLSNVRGGINSFKKGYKDFVGRTALEERATKKIEDIEKEVGDENDQIIAALGSLLQALSSRQISKKVPEIKKILNTIKKIETQETSHLKELWKTAKTWEKVHAKIISIQSATGATLKDRIKTGLGVTMVSPALEKNVEDIQQMIARSNVLDKTALKNIAAAANLDNQYRQNIGAAYQAMSSGNVLGAKQDIKAAIQNKTDENRMLANLKAAEKIAEDLERAMEVKGGIASKI